MVGDTVRTNTMDIPTHQTIRSVAVIESVSCNSCPKLISLVDVKRFGLGDAVGGYRCLECRVLFEKARDALQDGLTAVLSDRPVEEIRCRVCGQTFEILEADTQRRLGRKCRWFTQIKDGEMALMDEFCSDAYARKTELYRGTKYEHEAKLKGSK